MAEHGAEHEAGDENGMSWAGAGHEADYGDGYGAVVVVGHGTGHGAGHKAWGWNWIGMVTDLGLDMGLGKELG